MRDVDYSFHYPIPTEAPVEKGSDPTIAGTASSSRRRSAMGPETPARPPFFRKNLLVY